MWKVETLFNHQTCKLNQKQLKNRNKKRQMKRKKL